ncbi:MAG: hypothetical protein NTV19_14370 [Burkholderiales bacterium]|nr:hypothetical protein [Burkholderiales bacterium]
MTSLALLKLATTFFLGGFFSLVTIINPPSALPVFTALSAGLPEGEQARLARSASIYSLSILIVSLFAGGLILACCSAAAWAPPPRARPMPIRPSFRWRCPPSPGRARSRW